MGTDNKVKEFRDVVFTGLFNQLYGRLVNGEVHAMLDRLSGSQKKRVVGWDKTGIYYHSVKNTKKSIVVAKNGGLNPSILRCTCGKTMDGIVLPGKLYKDGKEVEAPMFMYTISLCPDCVCESLLPKLQEFGATYVEEKGAICFGESSEGGVFIGPEEWADYSYEHLKESTKDA